MGKATEQIHQIREMRAKAAVEVQTLGNFQVGIDGQKVQPKDWGRDKSVQLFQFFVTMRHHRGLHREQILDRLWPELDVKSGSQVFKVALHGINKVLEPHRKSRTEARFVLRQGLAYFLRTDEMWIDADALEKYIAIGNRYLSTDPDAARQAYLEATALHHGIYLPDRLYEDWSSSERERLQILALGAIITLGELLLNDNPLESIRLAEQALLLDPTWEDAYRLEMQAYLQKGNRPMAIKTFRQCQKILDREFGIEPLPETKKLMKDILNVGQLS